MKGKMNAKMGNIIIDRDVLAKYAGAATAECIGIVGMAAVNVKDGVIKLLKKENAGRGVNVYVVDNRIKVELHIIVAYGVSIRAVAQNVLEHVRYKIETFTGMEVEQIFHVVKKCHTFLHSTPNVSVYTLLLYFYGEKRFPALLHISKHIIAYFGGYFNECTKLSEASYIVVFESFDRIVFFDLMHGVHHAGKYNHKDTKDNDGNTAPWDLETDVHCT